MGNWLEVNGRISRVGNVSFFSRYLSVCFSKTFLFVMVG